MKDKIPLKVAEDTAKEFIEKIKPWCERVDIAGSVRRKKAVVGDIEIVCIPKVSRVSTADIWGNPIEVTVNSFDVELDKLIKEGVLARPQYLPRFGQRYKKLIAHPGTQKEIQVDIFECLPPSHWGVFFTIRTGSAEFSHSLVTYALEIGMRVKDNQLLKVRGANKDGSDIIPCPEEIDFFAGLGIPFIEPPLREGWYDPKHGSTLDQGISTKGPTTVGVAQA